MSLISNKKYSWMRAEVCVVTMAQDCYDTVYPDRIIEILERDGAIMRRC